jgi:glycosyltransferase involved in cell wall biosynthesis
MKIILASSSSGSRGGGELYLLYLGRALAQRGHYITLWASAHPRMDELANSFSAFGEVMRSAYHNTYDQRGRSLTSELNLWATGKVALEWKHAGADFLHLNKQNLEDGLDLIRAARICGLPSICTIHLAQSARHLRAKFGVIRDFLARRALRAYPGMLVTPLESRRRDLLSFLGPTPRVRTIPSGVPLFDLRQRDAVRCGKRQELGFADGDLLFIGVGRMAAQKRPLLFLETAQRILQDEPSARFIWIGDGPMAPEWDRWVSERNLSAVIRRTAWQPDVQPFLLSADVFLHVAEYEGLPLALLEAMSAALPVLLTENLLAEMPFLNASNSVGINTTFNWKSLLADRQQLKGIGQAARQLCEEEFSHNKMAESYELLYEFTRRRKGT